MHVEKQSQLFDISCAYQLQVSLTLSAYYSPRISMSMQNHAVPFEIQQYQQEQVLISFLIQQNAAENYAIQQFVRRLFLHFHLPRTSMKMPCACQNSEQKFVIDIQVRQQYASNEENEGYTNLKSEFEEAKTDKNWFTDIPSCKSHHGTTNSGLLCFLLHTCHCSILRLLGTVNPPP